MSPYQPQEKGHHPLHLQSDTHKVWQKGAQSWAEIKGRLVILTLLVVALITTFDLPIAVAVRSAVWGLTLPSKSNDDVCQQVDPWEPGNASLPATPSPRVLAQLLSGAVQVNTSVYDDYPLPVSSYPQIWQNTFEPLRTYLKTAFPVIHSSDKVILELVNDNGLLYTWTGSDSSLKPIVFMAHQDVVPVDPTTISSWTHPPFSGFIDEKEGLVFGRGAGDDKASLITLMTSMESLLGSEFSPKRTIIFSFGFDEEASGTQGGEALAAHLESVYGRHSEGNGVYMIVDEGNAIDTSSFGFPVAMPALSEKGYLDVKVTVNGEGGHSSEPPKHTTIGILSKIISHLEDNPPSPSLTLKEDGDKEDSPGLQTLLCLRDAPTIRKSKIGVALERLVRARKLRWSGSLLANLAHRSQSKKLNRARDAFLLAARETDEIGAFVTTQAVDLISGGVKINALPEEATAVINHRISVDESVADVRERLIRLIKPVAERYGCQVADWSAQVQKVVNNCVVQLADAYESALEPAPRTPSEGREAGPYRLLSSVIRKTWSWKDQPIRVVPSLMQGNTDTKSYHLIAQHIFRFSPNSLEEMTGPPDGGIHTVDERVQIDSLTKGFEFYTALMVAVQQ